MPSPSEFLENLASTEQIVGMFLNVDGEIDLFADSEANRDSLDSLSLGEARELLLNRCFVSSLPN